MKKQKMKNFDEKMITKAKNLKSKITLPKRWVYKLARQFDRGLPIPLFENNANNYAIEAECSRRALKKTHRRNYEQNRLTTIFT
jgi:hypothetical protein